MPAASCAAVSPLPYLSILATFASIDRSIFSNPITQSCARVANVMDRFPAGSMWTAAAHVITAVIGSGVLSLAWSIAQLGWVAGPAAMLVFAGVTALQSTLFADCYRSPDPEHGPHRNRTYAGAVDRNLGTCRAPSRPSPFLPFAV
jgi:hypothetical protein